MVRFLLAVAQKFWPELGSLDEQRRLARASDVIVSLAFTPLALAALAWLAARTDLEIIRRNWPYLALFAALIVLFDRVNYFLIVEIRNDRYGSADGSFANMVGWAAALLFGPTAVWLSVVWSWLRFAWTIRLAYSKPVRWGLTRGFLFDQSANTLGFLAGLALYSRLGGNIPIAGLTPGAIAIALLAILAHFLVVMAAVSGYIAYIVWMQRELNQPSSLDQLARFILVALGLPFLVYPFGILAAGLWVQNGIAVFIFFILGLLVVAIMARQLSWAVESSRQHSRQLRKLEELGREIINSPPDASQLPGLLEAHVPTMFTPGRAAIWLAPREVLYRSTADWELPFEAIWQWARQQAEARAFLTGEPLPWDGSAPAHGGHEPLVVAPIRSVVGSEPVGVVYLQLRGMAQPWDARSLAGLFPAVNTLAAQVASALHQAELYAETLEYQQAAQELAFAGRIQASFLPNELPRPDGWELAVTLLPARETSGDFFDFIPLPEGRIGLLIADVADKGMGAALYMALSRTLLRTYAFEYDTRPDIVILAANERILQDARANLFITAFYGILDPQTGTLTYCNAGHTTPYLLRGESGGAVQALATTGMPMGIEMEAVWGQASIQIEPGDVLILYTDGIPDAINSEGQFFREKQLVEVARTGLGMGPQEMQSCILEAVQSFAGDTPQFDDITLLVLMRYETG